ncbi:hypothetical protein M3Y95_00896900 [Aphelenchoides besseyi]|nr:hypothetical protein M3Y95_00896900 [Aphelenchoides besseyi]
MTARDIAAKMKMRRLGNQVRDEAEKLLADQDIPVGLTDYPQVTPSQSKNNIVIRTNFFEIEMKKDITVYQYHIDGALEFENFAGENEFFGQLKFTRVSQADALNIQHSEMTRKALMLSCMANPSLMPKIERLYYDGANVLFSLDSIGNKPKVYVHTKNQMVPTVHPRAVAIRITLTRTKKQITLGQLEREQRPRFECNEDLRPLLQFIEIATSEHAIQRDQHVMFRGGVAMIRDPLEHGFKNSDFPEMPEGTYLGVGCKKSSRLILNSNDEIKTALVVDPQVWSFHQRELVSEKVLRELPMLTEINSGDHLNTIRDLLKSLYFELVHRPGHQLKIDEISEKNAHTQTVTIDQETMTIFQYFQQRYDTTLAYPHLPLLVVKMRRNFSYYPMELSEIVEDQHLNEVQTNIDMQQRLLAGSTREPNIMDRDVLRTIASMKLDNSTHLSEAGLHVATDVLKVQGRMIRSPGMQYADAIKQFDSDNLLWKSGKYIEPAEIKKWAVYGIENTTGDKMSLDELRIHEDIKKAEQACGVITQNVTSEIACEAAGLRTNKAPQRITMENIVNKANIKNGGLNYHVFNPQTKQLLGKTDLFIGIATNIQGGGSTGQRLNAPTVVGYAANDVKSACAFTGNYIYQPPLRDEKVSIIGCVDPYAPEFYLLGHVGRLGTAKMPRYTILANDAKISMDDLQELSYHLCFAHQIVNDMTSLPTPVYVAKELAALGRTIYFGADLEDNELLSFEELTEKLDYTKWAIRDHRFTA